METDDNTRFTSIELTSLWQNYINDSMSICIFDYFLEKVEDKEIQKVIEHVRIIAKEHVEFVEQIFN